MKLFKQLLPVATIASIATIVAPIITSCGYNNNFCSWTQGQTYEPMKPKEQETIEGGKDALTKKICIGRSNKQEDFFWWFC